MKATPQAQGDLYVRKHSPSAYDEYPNIANAVSRGATKQVDKRKGMKIHFGEGKDHVHVLKGDATVTPVNPYVEGIKAWNVQVGDGGAKLVHMNKNGRVTGEHGTLTLEPGLHQIRTQRQLGPDFEPVAVLD